MGVLDRYERTPSGRMGHVTELSGVALYLAAYVPFSVSLLCLRFRLGVEFGLSGMVS